MITPTTSATAAAIFATTTAADARADTTPAIALPMAIIGPTIAIAAITPIPPSTHFQCFLIKSKNPFNFWKFSGFEK